MSTIITDKQVTVTTGPEEAPDFRRVAGGSYRCDGVVKSPEAAAQWLARATYGEGLVAVAVGHHDGAVIVYGVLEESGQPVAWGLHSTSGTVAVQL